MSAEGNKILFNNTGIPRLEGACIVIIKTEWNHAIVDELETGCREVLGQYGITNIITQTVPGAVEIPFAVNAVWRHADVKPDGFVTLGCVIRGGTPHFEYVCRLVTDGVLQLNLQLPVPVIFGVLTVDDAVQARERVGGKDGHKGKEAAMTVIKMIAFTRSLQPTAKVE